MRSRSSIRGCVRPSVRPSVCRSHMSWNHEKVPFLTKNTISTSENASYAVYPALLNINVKSTTIALLHSSKSVWMIHTDCHFIITQTLCAVDIFERIGSETIAILNLELHLRTDSKLHHGGVPHLWSERGAGRHWLLLPIRSSKCRHRRVSQRNDATASVCNLFVRHPDWKCYQIKFDWICII